MRNKVRQKSEGGVDVVSVNKIRSRSGTVQ